MYAKILISVEICQHAFVETVFQRAKRYENLLQVKLQSSGFKENSFSGFLAMNRGFFLCSAFIQTDCRSSINQDESKENLCSLYVAVLHLTDGFLAADERVF